MIAKLLLALMHHQKLQQTVISNVVALLRNQIKPDITLESSANIRIIKKDVQKFTV